MAQRDAENLISKLRAMGEEGISSFFSEVMGNDRLRGGFGKAGQRFMENKQTFDRNVETVLDFVNIPTKKDVRDLKQRLDHLSSQLLNLNIKLDRLLADDGERKPSPSKPRARKKD
jgi:polyhydroxyalkanoate synthesis regulator phasin